MTPKHHLKGFASLTPERRREIASKGGASVSSERHVGFESLSSERLREIAMRGVEARRKKSLTPSE